MFDIGQRVICVDDSGFPMHLLGTFYEAFPRKGSAYVVRDIVPAADNGKDHKALNANTCAVLLQGIRNKPSQHGVECGYRHSRFVPIEENGITEEQLQECMAELVK